MNIRLKHTGFTHHCSLSSLLIFMLTVATLPLIYRDITNHAFLHWDDIYYVVNNRHLRNLSIANVTWMFTDYTMTNWLPLTWLSHSVDIALWGYSPVSFKIVNIFIHIFNCILFYKLSNLILLSIKRNALSKEMVYVKTPSIHITSLFASCLFAIHPQHVESVVWVAERKDVLCALFYFSAMLAYVKYINSESTFYRNMVAIFSLMAAMSKPMAVSLPIALIVLDIFVLNRLKNDDKFLQSLKLLLSNKIILLVISAFIACITLFTQVGVIKDTESVGILTRIINASEATIHYMSSTVIPINQSPFYPFSETSLDPSLLSLLPVMLILVMIGTFWCLAKNGYKLLLFSFCFFLVTVLPVIGLISVGDQAYADRYTYIPTSMFYMTICAYLVISLERLPYRYSHILTIGLPLVVIALFSYESFTYVKIWRNDKSLWETVINKYPGKVYTAYQNLGNAYFVKSDYVRAIRQYNIALEINENSPKTLENLGRSYENLGNPTKAVHYYKRAIELDPDFVWPYLLLGYHYLRQKQPRIGSFYIRRAGEVNPLYAPVIVANAELDALTGNVANAKRRVSYILDHDPDNISALVLLAKFSYLENNYGSTRQYIKRILDISPTNKTALDLKSQLSRAINTGSQNE